jgi:hypothetical protein
VSNTSSDVEELVPVDTSSLSLVRVDLAKEVLAPHWVEGDVREMGACLGQDLVDHPGSLDIELGLRPAVNFLQVVAEFEIEVEPQSPLVCTPLAVIVP